MSDESLKGMAEQNKRYEYRSDGIFRFAYAVDRGSRRNHGWSVVVHRKRYSSPENL